MVQRFTPALGGSDGDVQIILNSILADKIVKTAGSQVDVNWYVFSTGFTRYYALYLNLTPIISPGIGPLL